MSVESAKNFLKKLTSDEEFKKSIENAASDEDRQKVVKDAGFEFTKAEIKEVVGSNSELSDADLEKVAGGSALEWAAAGAGIGTAVASAF